MIPYVMLYTVAAGVPILLAAVALAAVLRSHGKPERAIWLGALALAFALPAFALLGPIVRTTAEPGAVPDVGVIGLPEFVVIPVEQSSLGFSQALLAAWLLVSSSMAIRWGVAAYRLSRASQSWRPDTIDGFSVLLTDDVGPAVSGLIRPRVLAPSWLHTLPDDQRSLILMHEEEHIRALDPILTTLARTACIATPWNPVVWMLSARLMRAVELDCDRRVLRHSADVAAYGHTLINVSSRRPSRLEMVAAFAESEAPLRNRILSMTTPPRTVSVSAVIASTVLGAVLLVAACGVPVPTTPVDGADAVPDQTPTVTAFDTPPTPPSTPRSDLAMAVPRFTPMTVRPSLMNMSEVQQALIRAYPAVLRDAGIGGAPVVWIHINTSGVVDEVRIHESSGHEALDEGAIQVAMDMRFSPAFNGDQTTAAWFQIPIRFQVVN